jgi:hypothetical protein
MARESRLRRDLPVDIDVDVIWRIADISVRRKNSSVQHTRARSGVLPPRCERKRWRI